MGLDRRLREELHEHASSIRPDTAGRMEAVMQRGGRRGRWSGALAGVAAAVLLVAVAGTMLPLGRPDATLTGTTWAVTLVPEDPGVANLGMAGTWSLRLGERSTVELIAPPRFETPRGVAPDGYLYRDAGATITTTLFSRDYGARCVGPATYAWAIDGDRLTFTGNDPCDARAVLLSTSPWVATEDVTP